MEDQPIENKIAKSGLISLDLEDFYPEGQRLGIDMKEFLFQEAILREKDFRESIKSTDWSVYQDAYVYIYSSVDAIIPLWSYMLLASALAPFAKKVVFGKREELEAILYSEVISGLDLEPYKDSRIIVKGCSNKPVPNQAFISIVEKLQPIAKSVMFGEACSTVPVYKKK